MQVISVNDKKSINDFHKFPYSIYKNDPNWTPPLRMMVESTFDSGRNSALSGGDVKRWLVSENGKILGRISAFVVKNYSQGFDQLTGGIGFFECVDDQKVANLLFDTSRDWLKEHGMEAMDGPINIGENFFNWGLLVDGFMPQGFGMQYNPPYYRVLFENYGFETYYKQFSYHLDITSPDLPERFWKIAAWTAKKPGYTYE